MVLCCRHSHHLYQSTLKTLPWTFIQSTKCLSHSLNDGTSFWSSGASAYEAADTRVHIAKLQLRFIHLLLPQKYYFLHISQILYKLLCAVFHRLWSFPQEKRRALAFQTSQCI
jgi:hypothetical protein